MSETVNVGSIDAIEELRAALLRLREETQASLTAARLALQAERDWLSERQQHWQHRVTTLAEELLEAEAALTRCRGSRRAAASDGCRAIAEWTERTRRALWEAEVELRNVRHWRSVVDERGENFERRARVMTHELTQRIPLAATELTQLADLLNGYAAR
jgi:FtsZ-binding cell division protein ZapB